MKFKRGYTREDGMVFWAYRKNTKNNEYWVSKELFQKKFLASHLNTIACRQRNPNMNKESCMRWTSKNRERTRENAKKWNRLNKEKRKIACQKRLKNNPVYLISCRIRTLLAMSLSKNGYTKKSKTYSILGCSFESLKNHFEIQFQDGMNWENHGRYGWHIDHIIPVSSAKTENEVIKLNHYKNLQPLWAEENLKKSNKVFLSK
jgi:hypothetical protein